MFSIRNGMLVILSACAGFGCLKKYDPQPVQYTQRKLVVDRAMQRRDWPVTTVDYPNGQTPAYPVLFKYQSKVYGTGESDVITAGDTTVQTGTNTGTSSNGGLGQSTGQQVSQGISNEAQRNVAGQNAGPGQTVGGVNIGGTLPDRGAATPATYGEYDGNYWAITRNWFFPTFIFLGQSAAAPYRFVADKGRTMRLYSGQVLPPSWHAVPPPNVVR